MSLAAVLRGTTIGLIGAGNMGQALLKGLRAAGMPAQHLLVVETDTRYRRAAQREHGARATTLQALVQRSDAIILAVKPHDLRPVLAELGVVLKAGGRRRPAILSIAAGVRIAAIERLIGHAPVVRVMPNLAAKVGQGISVLAAGRWASRSDRALATAIFRCVGETVELPERLFDVVTAISGSGPAYFFLIFQALRDAGVRGGLPKVVAQRLAVRTALGSAQLVDYLGEDLETLIAQVASKKGTTEAALTVFRRRRLAQTIGAGVSAATRRSRQLSESLSQSSSRP